MALYAKLLVMVPFAASVAFLLSVAIAKFVSHRIGVRYQNTRR